MQTSTTLLIDGNNTLHRAHWVATNFGAPLVNTSGINVGTTLAFLKIIKSNATQFNTNKVYIAWDKKLSTDTNFRKTLTEGTYKNNRDTERNKNVYEEIDTALGLVALLGCRNIFPGKLEADDVISWLSKTITGKKVIVSVDNDFAQLVNEEVSFFNPIKKIIVDNHNFTEHYGLTPKEHIFYKTIAGDKSDNIPGIEGFGKIKGRKLAKAYASGDPETVKLYKEHIDNTLKLVDLSYGIGLYPEEVSLYEQQLSTLSSQEPDFCAFTDKCNELELNSITKNISDWKNTFNKSANNQALVDFCKLFT